MGIAIVGVGSALVALFVGVGVILSLGHAVPTTLWSAASALSGALVGILVPPPTSKSTKVQLRRQAASLQRLTQAPNLNGGDLEVAHRAIELAALIAPSSMLTTKSRELKTVIDQTAPSDSEKATAVAGASEAVATASQGADAVSPLDVRVIALAAVGAVAFVVGILLTFKVGGGTTASDVFSRFPSLSGSQLQTLVKAASTPTVNDASVKGAADALVALGSAAGGALVGLLAPSPSTTTSGQ